MTRLEALWRGLRSPRYRYVFGALVASLVMLLVGTAMWLPGERQKLQEKQLRVDRAVQDLQNDLAEIDRLKARPRPQELTGSALQETLVASLGNQFPSLTVSQVDADHARIQGQAAFDGFIRWLGGAQQSHRLGVTSLAVSRSGEGATVDVTLSAARE